MIRINQNAWLYPHIDMNTDLRKKAKNDFEKEFFKLMINAVFGKFINQLIVSQQKEEGSIEYLNQIIILKIFSQKI